MNKGFTLIEILVSVLILSLLFAAIYGVLNIGNIIFKDDMTLVQLQQQARQAMHWMVRETRQTNTNPAEGNISIVSSSEITFSIPPENYVDAWIGPIRYYLDTQKDQIIREHPTEPPKILANDITVLSFSLAGDVVVIELAAKKAARGRDLCFPVPYCNDTSKTLKEKVKLRNE